MGFFRPEYWSGLHFLLQGIFLTQGSNSGLSHCRQILYCLSHQESPKWGEESLIASDQVLHHQVVTSFERPPSTSFSFNCLSLPIPYNLFFLVFKIVFLWLLRWFSSKESACQTADIGSIPGSGRSPGEGNGYSLHYSCLENPRHIWFKYGQRSLAAYSPWGHKRI